MGMSNEEIVEKLMLWPTSVRRNVSRILSKLHLRDRVQIAVAWYKSAEWPESTTRSPVWRPEAQPVKQVRCHEQSHPER